MKRTLKDRPLLPSEKKALEEKRNIYYHDLNGHIEEHKKHLEYAQFTSKIPRVMVKSQYTTQ